MNVFLLNLLIGSAAMSAVALLLVAVCRFLKRKATVKACCFGWTVVLLGFLLCVLPVRMFDIITLPSSPASSWEIQTAQTQIAVGSTTFFEVLFIIWIHGVLLFLLMPFFRQARFCAWLKRQSPCADERLNSLARHTADKMNIKKDVKIYILPDCTTPMMSGLLRPIILLPRTDYTDEEAKLIFSHELMHFRHKDNVKTVLFLLCRALHWFNPLFMLIKKAMDESCELYCDLAVMSKQDRAAKKKYCFLILDTACTAKSALTPAVSTALYSKKEALKDRMSLILSEENGSHFLPLFAAVLILTLLSACLFSFGDTTALDTQATTQLEQGEQLLEETTIVVETPM